MKKYFHLFIIYILFLLAGCDTKSEPPTVGKKVSFDRICDPSNDGKRIAVEGFLTLPETVSSKNAIVMLEIRSVKDVKKPGLLDVKKPGRVGVWMTYGTAANQVATVETARRLPGSTEKAKSSYTHADLKVTTNNGKSIGYLDRVRVSGRVGFPSKVSVSPCVLNNPLIEKI